MSDTRVKIQRRLRKKVILVPRKKTLNNAITYTYEMCLAALEINPSERTEKDVDAIMGVVGKWPIFQQFIRSEPERREVCRSIVLEKKFLQSPQIVFSQGDDPDGWYLVYAGKCQVFIEIPNCPEEFQDLTTPNIYAMLKKERGMNKSYKGVAFKGPATEFGNVALTKNSVRNATIVAIEPSLLLRVDPVLYRDTAAWFDRAQLEKKAALLSHVPEFQFLRDNRELFSRIAENMTEIRFDTGEINFNNLKIANSFIVIEEGILAQHRMVDFSSYKQENDTEMDETLIVKLPKGKAPVRTKTYGPKRMFPLPNMTDIVPYPFSMVVLEPALGYVLKISDLETLLPKAQLAKIFEAIRNEPSDKDVIELWIEKQRNIQWQQFRQRCVKEARQEVKIERQINNGTFGMRRAGIPKPIKEKSLPPMRNTFYEDL